METILELYHHELRRYSTLQQILHAEMEKVIDLVPAKVPFPYSPTRGSLLAEIAAMPKTPIAIPPMELVKPQTGSVQFDREAWQFSFHGMGVSFSHGETATDTRDVSVEYSHRGQIALTEWTAWKFFNTMCREIEVFKTIRDSYNAHRPFLQKAVEHGLLIPVPPLLDGDDQTYICT